MDADLKLNENVEFIAIQMANGLKYLIAQFKQNNDIQHLNNIFKLDPYSDIKIAMDIWDSLADLDFLIAICHKLKQIIDRSLSIYKSTVVLIFLTLGTDKSKLFCNEIVLNDDFLLFLGHVTQTEEDFFAMFLKNVVLIINNICFQTECDGIGDLNLKTFLITRAEYEDQKFFCIFTLLRISNQEEIRQFENEICSIIEDYVDRLKETMDTLNYSSRFGVNVTLDELVKQLKPLLKCEKAKQELSSNQVFRELCRKLRTSEKFSKYYPIISELVSNLFFMDDLSHLDNEDNLSG